MNIEDFVAREQRPRLTLLERLPMRSALVSAAVYTRIGLAQQAAARGKALVKELKPILRREANLKVNIAHAYGIARCNEVLGEHAQRVNVLEALQQRVAAQFNITLNSADGIPAGESESTQHVTDPGNRVAAI